MILFRPMSDTEYLAYLDYFIPDYAAEISSNHMLSPSISLAQAKREIAIDLPDGINTDGQVLLCLVDLSGNTEKLIGYLWYSLDTEMRSVFICDFHILASYQGQGFGKQALKIFENELKDKGFKQIKLRVAKNNKHARHVYKSAGFHVTGINMSKSIVMI